MTATCTFKEIKDHPLFSKFSTGDGRWHHTGPDGTVTPCGDFRSESSHFGSVEYAIVVDNTGAPVFDRPLYREAPNVNIVAYGRDTEGTIRIAIIRQPRPHADDPSVQKGQKHDPVVFGQIPMGFLEKLIGKDLIPRQEKATQEPFGRYRRKQGLRRSSGHINPNGRICSPTQRSAPHGAISGFWRSICPSSNRSSTTAMSRFTPPNSSPFPNCSREFEKGRMKKERYTVWAFRSRISCSSSLRIRNFSRRNS